ncbi:MAG: AraC family transcriptional regulator [Cytophagales bacterium]|nr:AraC family transcriptional regulator [Cytophagales bacterium]
MDLVKNLGDGVVEVVFIHLFPHILKEVFANELPDALRKGDHFDHLNIVSHEKVLTKYIDSLELYFQTPTLANDDILFLKIKELVLLLIQTKNVESIYEIVSEINSGPHVELRKVVRKHLYSTLSTEELAKMCNMSLSTFNRNFKKEFNDSPVSYINHRRIEKAQELLQQSNKSIADIAYSTGFNDPLYFSRLFKRETKKSPTQYREELKG